MSLSENSQYLKKPQRTGGFLANFKIIFCKKGLPPSPFALSELRQQFVSKGIGGKDFKK